MYQTINFLRKPLTWMSKKILSNPDHNLVWTPETFLSGKKKKDIFYTRRDWNL